MTPFSVIFECVVCFFGTVSALRTLQCAIDDEEISKHEARMAIGSGAFALLLIYCVVPATFRQLSAPALPPIFAHLAVRSVCWRKHSRRGMDLLRFLDSLILELRLGNGIRDGVENTAREMPAYWRTSFQKALEEARQGLSRAEFRRCPLIGGTISEIVQLEQTAIRVLERVQFIREHVRMETHFRAKTGQVLARFYIQTAVLTVLFFAVAIFSFLFFGWKSVEGALVVSVPLFCAGVLVTWLLGRRLAWKV